MQPEPRPAVVAKRLSREEIRHRQGALKRAMLRRLHADREPADPITTKLFADLKLAGWAIRHSPDREEARVYEREVFEFLIRWLGALERPDLRLFDYCPTVEARVINQTAKLRTVRR